jgi:hypothetical protein
MKKFLVITISLLLIGFGIPTQTYADSANPPKIVKVNQLTQGPYLPGDMIQFSLEISGGNPGLRSVQISSECFNVAWFNDSKAYFNYFGIIDNFDPNYINQSLLTTRIGGCRSKMYTASIMVVDQTLLSDGISYRSAGLNFEVKNKFLPKLGEVQPDSDFMNFQSQDDVSWDSFVNIGKDQTRFNNIPISKLNDQLTLPGFTKLGQPLDWFDDQNKFCEIVRRFPGDVGKLKFLGEGKCFIYSSVLFDGIKFNVGGNKKIGEGLGRYSFVISKQKVTQERTITCIKGKTTKKVSGTNPKCPKGYKVKV